MARGPEPDHRRTLLCSQQLSVLMEYNIWRHIQTYRSEKYKIVQGHQRIEKINYCWQVGGNICFWLKLKDQASSSLYMDSSLTVIIVRMELFFFTLKVFL